MILDFDKAIRELQAAGFSEGYAEMVAMLLDAASDARPDRPFDTLAQFRRLVVAGFSEAQADALVRLGLKLWATGARLDEPRP